MGKMGFIQDDNDDKNSIAKAEEVVCDLNNELIEAMNILIDVIKYHKGTIRGITISIDNQGVRSTQINY